MQSLARTKHKPALGVTPGAGVARRPYYSWHASADALQRAYPAQ